MRYLLLTLLLTPLAALAQDNNACKQQLQTYTREQEAYARLLDPTQRSNSSTNFDVYYYRCNWQLNPAVRNIQGSVTPYFKMLTTGNKISFDLRDTMVVDSVKYGGSQISFTRPGNNSIEVTFPVNLFAPFADSVTIFYKGVPDFGLGYFEQTTHAGTPIIWTLSQPYGARYWWPCKDNLNDKADSIELTLTFPDTYTSACNGVVTSNTTSGGNRTMVWKHRYKIVSYLISIAVTNYTVLNNTVNLGGTNLPVVTYAFPESLTTFQNSVPNLQNALGFFNADFGPYPYMNELYGQTQIVSGGGMEHQTNSYVSSAGSSLMAHELGHQWFGDKVTCGSWQDLWLNEGFATFCEAYYTEKVNPANLRTQLQGVINSITSQLGGAVFVTDTVSFNTLFNSRLVYNKGSYLVRMLRWKLGDVNFFQGLRNYLTDPLLSYSFARTTDLQRNLQNISGLNLTEFFNDWLYGQGYPTYSIKWNQNGANATAVQVNQTQSHVSVGFFEMPVPVRFTAPGKDTTIVLDHTSSGQTFQFQLNFAATAAEFDPNLWILSRNNTITKDPALVVTAVIDPVLNAAIQVLPNPVQQQLTIATGNAAARIRSLQLYDAAGKLVFVKEYANGLAPNTIQVDMSRQTSGMYLLKLNTRDGKVVTKKLLKE
jgi:aminopeptidase N